MAGIGFELRKVLYEGNALEKTTASIKSIFVTSGPWIISIISIIAISNLISNKIINTEFNTIVMYTFIFSIILHTPLLTLITKYLSDKLYLNDFDSVIPIMNSAILFVSMESFLISYLYIKYNTNITYIYSTAAFFTTVSILWTVMIFISTLKNYTFIFYTFLIGIITSYLLIYFHDKNLYSLLKYYSIGFSIISIFLILKIKLEFNNYKLFDFNFFIQWKYYIIFFSSLFLILAMWIDKFMYWGIGKEVMKGFYINSVYDNVMLYSFLTLIPPIAYFNIFSETDLYEKQSNFLYKIENGFSLGEIRKKESDLRSSIKRNLLDIIHFQLIFTIFSITFIGIICEYLHFPLNEIPVFRITLLSVAIQMILNSAIIFLYYFNYQKEVLFISIVYLVLNILLTDFFLKFGSNYIGYSYFLSVLISLLITGFIMLFKFNKIMFYTFMENEI